MNYDDELERTHVKRSRKRENNLPVNKHESKTRTAGTEESIKLNAEAGSRAARNQAVTSARRKKKKKSNTLMKVILGILLALVVVVVCAAAGLFGYFNGELNKAQEKIEFKQEEVKNPNISVEKAEEMEKGFWTVAVFGVDSRDNSLGEGNQSDVIMIANLNRETGEIKLVSVFRDTYLNVNDRNTYNKINAAYAAGGPEQAVKAINKNLDLNITHYATFNWKAVATVINILGGVEIDISPAEFYYINAFITETVKGTGIGSVQLKSAGVHNLDGVQAVAYGRLRLMDTDYARTERQRIVIQKAFEKVKTAKLSTLNDVVGHVFEMSATNIGFEDLAGLIKDVTKYHLSETTGFPAARGEERIKIGKDRLSCVIPQTLESNVISLHNFLYGDENYTPSATVKEISAKIAEISGLAKEAEEIGHVPVDKGYVPKPTTAPAETKAPETEGNTEGSADSSESAESTEEGEELVDPEEPDDLEDGERESEVESGSAAETEEADGPLFPGVNHGPGSTSPTNGSANSEGPRFPGDVGTEETTEGHGPGSIVPEATTEASRPGLRPGSGTSVNVTKPGNSEIEPEYDSPVRPGSSSATVTPGGTTNVPGGNTKPSEGTNKTPAGSASTETTNKTPTGSATTETTNKTPAGATGDKPTAAPGGSSPTPNAPSSSSPSSPADGRVPSGTVSGPAAQATSPAAPGM